MKRKLISAILVAAMTIGMLAGCGSSETETSDNGDAVETETVEAEQVQLSSPDYEFEKEYIFSDFNLFSNEDIDRQGGIDTFEEDDKMVLQDITYDQLISLLQQEGNYLIQLTGSWCHNSRAMAPYVSEYAEEYGIDTIYTYDFNLNNGIDGAAFARMTNGSENIGVNFNYMYGEFVTNYLTNLDDWVQFPSDSERAITYTNANGEEVTVARLQQPYLFLYNKDNTVDGKAAPVVNAFEVMVDRDADGIYTSTTDEDGNVTKEYVTDEYAASLREFFDYIKDNNIEISEYTKEDYMKDTFNSYGTEIFAADESVNVYPITYRQLVWLVKQAGDSLVLFGSPSDEATRAVISNVNDYAVKNNLRIFMFNPVIDGGVTTDVWGYTNSASICDENSLLYFMYTDLIEAGLTNLEASQTAGDGNALIQTPYLFAYNKDAKDADGFVMPITAYSESVSDEEILTVLQSYAESAGITVE